MILSIGEILYDHFPDGKRIGGAPFNVAYHLHHLGTECLLLTRVGKDADGKDLLSFLRRHRFPVKWIQTDSKYPTGKVEVQFDEEKNHQFDILPDRAFDHIQPTKKLEKWILQPELSLIYFGTLAQRTESGFQAMQHILTRKSLRTKCLYDINLRKEGYTFHAVIQSLKHADIVKCNREELQTLKSMLDSSWKDARFIFDLMQQYDIEIFALTRGGEGSDVFLENNQFSHGPAPSTPIVDTVGAGDAYSTILALGYLRKWEPTLILEQASLFSQKICAIPGAIPEDPSFYDEWRRLNE